MYDLSFGGWLMAVLCGIVVGMAKCGIPGLGSLAVPLLAGVLPARTATGALLPLLVAGDAVGALRFKRNCNVKLLLRLLPISILGILLGYWLLGFPWMDDTVIRYATAVIILVLFLLNQWKSALPLLVSKAQESQAGLWGIALFFGLLAGVTTTLANAAGPVALIYLLAMGLPKEEFIATNAWFFLVMNWIKVPLMVKRDMITTESLLLNLKLLPALFLGTLLGMLLSKRLSNQAFRKSVEILTALAALLLFLPQGALSNLMRYLLGS